LLPLLMVATVACRGGSSPTPKVAASTLTTPSAGPGTTTGAPACHLTTSATGGTGGGDVLVPGDIPDTQHFVTFNSSDGYHLEYPEGWAQTQAGRTVTFTDKFNSVHVESAAAPAVPSVSSAQSIDVPALAASTPCFAAAKVTAVKRNAGPAVLITYRAGSPPDPVTGKVIALDVERYQFWQSGMLVTITLASPTGSDNVDPWRKVTDSFAWGS
jgi:hypothetical protein